MRLSINLVDNLEEKTSKRTIRPAGIEAAGATGDRLLAYRTPYGPGLLVWRGGLLAAHRLPGCHTEALLRRAAAGEPATAVEAGLAADLEAYFSGERILFDALALPLDLGGYTRFRLDVAAALAAVPYGRTVSYGGLAAAAGHPRAHRAVGTCMARNRFPLIIPCHRVIKGSGRLGNFASGKHWKERLLTMEGASLAGGVLLETAALKQ